MNHSNISLLKRSICSESQNLRLSSHDTMDQFLATDLSDLTNLNSLKVSNKIESIMLYHNIANDDDNDDDDNNANDGPDSENNDDNMNSNNQGCCQSSESNKVTNSNGLGLESISIIDKLISGCRCDCQAQANASDQSLYKYQQYHKLGVYQPPSQDQVYVFVSNLMRQFECPILLGTKERAMYKEAVGDDSNIISVCNIIHSSRRTMNKFMSTCAFATCPNNRAINAKLYIPADSIGYDNIELKESKIIDIELGNITFFGRDSYCDHVLFPYYRSTTGYAISRIHLIIMRVRVYGLDKVICVNPGSFNGFSIWINGATVFNSKLRGEHDQFYMFDPLDNVVISAGPVKISFNNNVFTESKLCEICMDRIRSVVLNCGHFVICDMCAKKQSLKNCPLCRRYITIKKETYLSRSYDPAVAALYDPSNIFSCYYPDF